MAVFGNDELEKLAEAERLARKRANTLGGTGDLSSEAFAAERTIPDSKVMRATPTASTDFASPEYADYTLQDGSVGTRYGTDAVGVIVPIRLHSYVSSGLTGPESCQTFFTIDPTKSVDGHSAADINTARMYPLIGPEFSMGRASAAETVDTLRGFELALYPAQSSAGVGTALTYADAYGPISINADPGAGAGTEAAGAGDSGFWTVDYDAGVIRFSRPPLHGMQGVMNPYNVFGDIDGDEVASGDGGAIVMFAVFYKYDGEVGREEARNLLTVGDGVYSFGEYEGTDSTALQSAINSLPGGGTVYVKAGNYNYATSVEVTGAVTLVGTNRTRIDAPATGPAFDVLGSDISIDNFSIHTSKISAGSSCIRLAGSEDGYEFNNVSIRNNELYCKNDAYGVEFAPAAVNVAYKNIEIRNNNFKSEAGEVTEPIYIGETIGECVDC